MDTGSRPCSVRPSSLRHDQALLCLLEHLHVYLVIGEDLIFPGKLFVDSHIRSENPLKLENGPCLCFARTLMTLRKGHMRDPSCTPLAAILSWFDCLALLLRSILLVLLPSSNFSPVLVLRISSRAFARCAPSLLHRC